MSLSCPRCDGDVGLGTPCDCPPLKVGRMVKYAVLFASGKVGLFDKPKAASANVLGCEKIDIRVVEKRFDT